LLVLFDRLRPAHLHTGSRAEKTQATSTTIATQTPIPASAVRELLQCIEPNHFILRVSASAEAFVPPPDPRPLVERISETAVPTFAEQILEAPPLTLAERISENPAPPLEDRISDAPVKSLSERIS
jgi:hypothetical protein